MSRDETKEKYKYMHALSVPKMKLKILNGHECPEMKLKTKCTVN